MCGPYIHEIDPVALEFFGIYLWWYGLCYALGFLGLLAWFYRIGPGTGMSRRDAWSLTLLLMFTVLACGRTVEVFFYEWAYYRQHPWHVLFYWLGGMSTHGLLLGGAAGTLIFCRWKRLNFLAVADQLAVAAAWIMGLGRLANFIDGQIAGAVTDVCWAVQFPDLEGYRHPVVLYDGLKNLMLVPLLLLIGRRRPPPGVVFAHFVLWYAALRFVVDQFREYLVDAAFGLGTGQIINLAMATIGLVALVWIYRRQRGRAAPVPPAPVGSRDRGPTGLQKLFLIAGLFFCCLIPSDWTQDIPARYGERHPGLEHSVLYPPVASGNDGS